MALVKPKRVGTKPDVAPRLRMHIAALAHNSSVVVEPGPDDWFPPVDISRFVTQIDLRAKVGEATTAKLHVLKIDVDTDGALLDALTMRELSLSRRSRLRRWWFRHGPRFRTKLWDVTTVGNRAHRYVVGG